MSDENEWSQPASPPPPLFLGEKERDYVKQVNDELMRLAKTDSIYLHVLPAAREEEVTSSVIDGKQSLVWQQAENRLHGQKAIIDWCLSD